MTEPNSRRGVEGSRTRLRITALRDGRILIVGLGWAAVWDLDTDTSSPAGSHALSEPVSATLLPDGRVLVIGGEDPTSAEVWDPSEG